MPYTRRQQYKNRFLNIFFLSVLHDQTWSPFKLILRQNYNAVDMAYAKYVLIHLCQILSKEIFTKTLNIVIERYLSGVVRSNTL